MVPSSIRSNRTVALALELALLQGNSNGLAADGSHHPQQHHHHVSNGHPQLQHANSANFPVHHESQTGAAVSGLSVGLNGFGNSGSLEDLKVGQRRSQNMTECVPVPTSEHVAEIVGRQGE